AYSQTFIQAHRENLPARVANLYVQNYETFADDNGPLVKPEIPGRLARAILRRSLNLDAQHFQQHALRSFFRRNRVDAVLAEFGPTATLVMDVCNYMDIPLIAHFHGFDAYRHSTLESYGKRYQQLFETAAAIVTVSYDMQAQLIKLGAPAQKVHYNACGVDPAVFKDADPLNSPPVFVAVGRFVNKKAPHLTLLAFHRVLHEVPDARLIIIGDGPLWDATYQLARALNLLGPAELPGVLSHTDVARTMRNARAFVQHSLQPRDGDSEGTPVAVLEAGAAGLPVIATRHAGIKDVVIEGKTGLLVDEGDVRGMAEQMIRLAKDPRLAADIGSAARERVAAEFSMQYSIDRLWSIIDSAIQGSASR
ncbi:MAG TPA: glycosyltransferase, partial [Pyrinomonadaceae bacterium]|nr:glycosyltransferase [Pyrinomonadaceae bacterium]